MSKTLSLLCRVVSRRVKNGEKLTAVLKDYPKLTDAEKKELRAAIE